MLKIHTHAVRALEEMGIPYRLLVHAHVAKSVEQAAAERGVPTHQIVKTLLVRSSQPSGRFSRLEDLMVKKPSKADYQKLARLRPDPMEVALLGPTGGTTGLPKVAPRIHNVYLSRAEFAARIVTLGHASFYRKVRERLLWGERLNA